MVFVWYARYRSKYKTVWIVIKYQWKVLTCLLLLQIPVIADLPVGKNLQDHPGVPVFYVFNKDVPTVNQKLVNPANIEQYIQNRTGNLEINT